MRAVANLGERVWRQWDDLRHGTAVIGTVFYVSAQPRYWARPVRALFARQILAVGIEPLGFVCTVAAFVGISVVVQLAFWTGKAGQSQFLGPLLVAIVARELGPLLTNIIVIVRSSSAMATELGVLKITGGVERLEAEGNDPFLHLVLPRVLGVAVATFCLTIVFILVAFVSGYVFGAWLGTGSRDVWFFTNMVLNALPALVTSASCCIGGLGVGQSVTGIPDATQRALTRSIVGLFVISGTVSLLMYL
jgi:phospholipid/cholesterol/gamma-HCH transport system permease protein